MLIASHLELWKEFVIQSFLTRQNQFLNGAGFLRWYFMAIAQRCHKNDFEHLVTMLPLSLVNGLIYPLATSCLLAGYLVGRNLFTYGYMEKDGAFNKTRLWGSLTVNVAKLATFGITMLIGVRMVRGRLILQQALKL